MRNSVPSKFAVGESLSWEKSFSLYPASVWSLTYYFRGAGTGFDAVASADGTDFLIVVAASVTAEMSPGRYSFQAFVASGGKRVQVDAGDVTVIRDLAALAADDSFDNRSQVKKTLDAIDALIEGKASLDQLEYEIGNRKLRRYEMRDLLALRDKYAKLYAAELRAENAAKGGSPFKAVKIGFGRPR